MQSPSNPSFFLTLMLAIPLALLCPTGAAAQDANAQAAGDVLVRSWDANGDGTLDSDEIPEVSRARVYQLAIKQGLDPDKPLPVSKFLGDPGKKLDRWGKAQEKKRLKANGNLKKAAKKPSKKKQAKLAEAEAANTPKAAPKVRGFGTAADDPPTTAATNQATAPKPDKKSKAQKQNDARRRGLMMMAKSVLIQNDKNKSGKLERNEWSRLKGDPQAADQNRDGLLTTAELADHLAGYGAREKPVRRVSRTKTKRTAGQKPTYRFLTPHERLPKGLPPWFIDKDTNEDGQISLREFATILTAVKVIEFEQLDRNRDGLLIAKEYLEFVAASNENSP